MKVGTLLDIKKEIEEKLEEVEIGRNILNIHIIVPSKILRLKHQYDLDKKGWNKVKMEYDVSIKDKNPNDIKLWSYLSPDEIEDKYFKEIEWENPLITIDDLKLLFIVNTTDDIIKVLRKYILVSSAPVAELKLGVIKEISPDLKNIYKVFPTKLTLKYKEGWLCYSLL